MRILVALLFVCVIALPQAVAVAQEGETSTSAEDSFLDVGDDLEQEVEVTFAEEVDVNDLGIAPPLPEYDERPWLTVLPVLCALVIAWNVRWKGGRRRHEKRNKRP